MTRWMRIGLAVLAAFAFLFFRLPPTTNITPSTPIRSHASSYSTNISPFSIFIYNVYLDKRGGYNRLRVLAINRCHKFNESIITVRVNGSQHGLCTRPVERVCPWSWAEGCSLSTYIHEMDLPEGTKLNEAIIQGGYRFSVFNVTTVEDSTEEGLTICVPPLYWYSDWTKLILFVEWWKTQNATKFNFYHQSSTAEVREVLDYYESEGIVDVHPWSLLPKSANFNPNSEVYRLGHSLAMNDCILRANTEYVSLVDIDELIVPSNGTLLDLLDDVFTKSSVGSLLFQHRILLFNPPIAPNPFSFDQVTYAGVQQAIWKNTSGPPKAIVRRNLINRMSTHSVIDFIDEKYTQNSTAAALLLHNRYNYVGVSINGPETPIQLAENGTAFQMQLQSVRNKVFPNGANFKSETQRTLGACLASWRTSQNNCKAPATACHDVMKNLENWVETTEVPYVVV